MHNLRENSHLKKISHPLFLLALVILIGNDWYLKETFGNGLTGKLSDLAGLFIFPYLLSVLVPGRKKFIHAATVILFILWKSDAAQPVIDFMNSVGILIYRTVDYTDYIALISVWFSYKVLDQNVSLFQERLMLRAVGGIAIVACVATSLPPRKTVKFTPNKTYHFDFSKRELVSRLNALQMRELGLLSKMSGGKVNFDSETNVFHYHNQTDTLGILLDYTKIGDQDTLVYKTSYAEILITGDDALKSTLTLVAIYGTVPPTSMESKKDYSEQPIRLFERHVVKKIRKMSN